MRIYPHNATSPCNIDLAAPLSPARRKPLSSFPKNGFTLLEVILSLSIIAMLIGSIFAITSSSLSLSQSVVENQNRHRHTAALDQYFDSLFKHLPFDSKLALIADDYGYQTLVISNPGTFFPSKGKDLYALNAQTQIVKNRDGLLSLKVSWSNDPEHNQSDIDTEKKHTQSLILIDNLTDFRWEMYSTKDQAWYETWSKDLTRPSHIRLIYTTALDQQEHTQTFWSPPAARIN